jgi:hypothetical protein
MRYITTLGTSNQCINRYHKQKKKKFDWKSVSILRQVTPILEKEREYKFFYKINKYACFDHLDCFFTVTVS